jgi:hypothetical protein
MVGLLKSLVSFSLLKGIGRAIAPFVMRLVLLILEPLAVRLFTAWLKKKFPELEKDTLDQIPKLVQTILDQIGGQILTVGEIKEVITKPVSVFPNPPGELK